MSINLLPVEPDMYFTNGNKLFYVEAIAGENVLLEDCATLKTRIMSRKKLLENYHEVEHADLCA